MCQLFSLMIFHVFLHLPLSYFQDQKKKELDYLQREMFKK